MSEVTIQGTRIFYANQAAKTRIVVNRGSARSSKSYSIAQLILAKFLTEKNKKFLIVRKTLPSLRLSTWPVFVDLIDQWKVGHRIRVEKQYLNLYCGKNWLHFGSIDDPEKIKSTEWNYIWIEEATEFDYEDFITLKLRTSAVSLDGLPNQMYLSFNPIDEYHWLKTNLVDNTAEDLVEIHSTYKDNPYLPADYIQMLEQLSFQDPNFYRIYALGEWGRLSQLIFSNWQITRDFPPDTDKDVVYGLDFGFAEAPTVLMKTTTKNTDAWLQQLLYKKGLTNSALINILPTLIPNRFAFIFADNAEPARIEEIKRAGWANIRPAQKSVTDGIDFVKRFKLYIHEDSTECIKEVRTYSWKTDRSGNVIGEPVKYMDHCMDAIRYALYSWYKSHVGVRVRWL